MAPREESSSGMNDSGNAPRSTGDGATNRAANWTALRRYLMENKIDSALWFTRVFAIVNAILYLIPLLGMQTSIGCYKRVLISSAATSALRLHQRMPRFQFTRQYLAQLLMEDSCHYLLYCVIFISSHPVTMILIPVTLFALLHAVNFTKKLLDLLGSEGMLNMSLIRSARTAIQKVETHQQGLLRFIACTEIMLMPAVILMMFSGQVGIIIPFIYYRFLGLRYTSRRNPYCRQLFGEMRIAAVQLAYHQRCPGFLRTFIIKFTDFISRLAPDMQPPPQPSPPQQPQQNSS